MSCFVAFHYRSYGTFFLHKKGSIISIGDLPTTNIIEPTKEADTNVSASFLMIYESMKTTYPVSKIGRYSFLLPLL